MAIVAVFWIGAAAVGVLVALSVGGLVFRGLRFWPPPGNASWQYRVFWGLFRIYLLSLCTLSVLELRAGAGAGGILAISGWCLFLAGFSLATWITGSLGWANAHGEAIELKTDGWFAYSRNPIYVASILGMAGLALAIESCPLRVLLAAWGFIYVLAPFLEEPWLSEHYGQPYRVYLRRVPRYLGWRNDA